MGNGVFWDMLFLGSLRKTVWLVLVLVAVGSATGPERTRAAEIVFRRQASCEGSVMTLGNVADVLSSDQAEVEKLSAIELFPASATPRFLRQREIQDLLMLHEVRLAEHRFSGARQIEIRPTEKSKGTTVNAVEQKRAQDRLVEAIRVHLDRQSGSRQPWKIELKLGDEAVRSLLDEEKKIRIRGGAAPWVGRQGFDVVLYDESSAVESLSIKARVELPAMVVVAAVPLSRGTVIGPGEVQLVRDESFRPGQPGAVSLEKVIGMEVSRSIPAGKPVFEEAVQAPRLVRRGEIVTVVAKAGGVSVTTNARSKADAGMGELVQVESLSERKSYLATVSGLRKVEVIAATPQATSSSETAIPQTSSQAAFRGRLAPASSKFVR